MITKVVLATRKGLIALPVALASMVQAQVPTLTVDAAASQHSISPQIYGIANYGLDAIFAEEIKVPNIRWGGDGATRYNWEVDASNSGFDWYFTGGNGAANPTPSGQVDTMIKIYKPAGAGALVTIPIIPYVNKSSEYNCSFPTSVYGSQQSTNAWVHPDGENCGNSITSSGVQLKDKNVMVNHVYNTAALQKGWVEHLVATFGTAANGGVPFYQLDNEPFGWSNTHRDVEPNGATYPTIVALGQQYAAVIKQADPTAKVLGPSDFGPGGWIATPSQQNNLMAGQYYLQQMAAYEKAHGTRILDYFDEHYYPSFTDPTTQLASTRTLWDSTYNTGSWEEKWYFNGGMALIPRFQSWVATYYPGTKVSISEYSIDSGNKLITDALAEADVLGIFGREQLDFANMWTAPRPTDPIAYAFRLYRNYDGTGSQFGNTSVSAVSTNQAELSIYAAKRSSDGALTVIVINKSTSAILTTLKIANFKGSSAEVYRYSGSDLTAIQSEGKVSLSSNSLTYDYPAYSATVFVVGGAAGTSPVTPPPVGQPIANGTYTLKNIASSLVLDDPKWSDAAGTQMDEYSANGGANQRWKLVYSDGYYTVENVASGKYLTDAGTSASTTGALEQYPLESKDTQLWLISGGTGNWVIANKASGLLVADPKSSTTKLTGIVVEKATGGKNEIWSIQ